MKITLDSNPSGAPGCYKVIAEDGRDMLIQTDWDYPGIATTFGWSIQDVQNTRDGNCEHTQTDGTIDCPNCHVPVSVFIAAAQEYLEDNDGAEADDPGYFDND